jgi:SHS2 domain-containing protein
MPPDWENFPHDADIGIRGYGASKAEAFEQAAYALMAIITDPATIEAKEAVEIRCAAPDDELLLVDWINQLIFEMATRKMLFGRFSVNLLDNALLAMAWGEPTDVQRHHPAVEVKGATYTELRVTQENGRWLAQTIVDV